jgi:flagellar biosynthesis chaperone FliJ
LKKTREALLAAMQKRKTLDKLKDNGLRAYMENLSREEEKFINEMAISRFNNKQK